MPRRRLRVDPVAAVAEGLAAIRSELKLPGGFPTEVMVEAEAARPREEVRLDLRDVPFFTIDPPGSRDLDQAMAIERDGTGFRVRYAIADVGTFFTPGSAIDREAWARGVTVYLPDAKVPLHPPVLSEARASLLAGQERPALVWDLRLAGDGELLETRLERALVISRAQLTYEEVQRRLESEERFALLREVGELRAARARARGAVELRVPEQQVELTPDGARVSYRVPLPVEDHNAQISLLAGMAAAQIMLERGVGILRVQPAPEQKSLDRLRRQAAALGVTWPDGQPYAKFIRSLDPAQPAHAAVMHEAAGAGQPARYEPVTWKEGAAPSFHFALAMPYAHVTAPLRRLADRYALACCLDEPPDWAAERLDELPEAMTAADRRSRAAERAVVDLVEAVLLAPHVGETFRAVAVDEDTVQLREPAVRAKVEGCPPAGEEVTVRLTEADPVRRLTRFERA